MALDATVSGASANAYCDRAYADAFHVDRGFNAEWSAATTAVRDAAIIWATRLLERLEWRGGKTTTAQALRWPRGSAATQDYVYYANTIIPGPVKDATAELALYLVKEDRTVDSGAIGLNSLKVGSISLDFDSGAYTKAIPDGVMSMISFLLHGSGSTTFRSVARA